MTDHKDEAPGRTIKGNTVLEEVWVTHWNIDPEDPSSVYLGSVSEKPWPITYQAPITEYADDTRFVNAGLAHAQIKAAEAKLAKAVEALGRIEVASQNFAQPEMPELACRYAHETTRRLARAALAEIGGEKP